MSGLPIVRVRQDPERVREVPVARFGAGDLVGAEPWRTFRWRRGQKHFSGFYWCATTRTHVAYESQLELARLLLADFDRAVESIYAQPFQLVAEVGGRRRRHVPDFLLVHRDQTVTVINVKPADQLGHPEVVAAVEWTGRVVRERGWRLEVWSGEDAVFLANVRFLAGFRRAWLFDPGLLDEAATAAPGLRVADVEQALDERGGQPLVRPALMQHLLWSHRLVADLTRPLSGQTVLGGTPG
jgi:hypothetical protein